MMHAVFLLLLGGVAASDENANTCMGAFSIIMGLEQNCPKNCDESDDGICPGGKKERDPSSCGASAAPQCETWLTENVGSEENIEEMVAGLGACEGEMAGFANAAQMGKDYIISLLIRPVYENCGYEPPYAMPSASTCMGAFSLLSTLDQYCPKNCDESDDGLCPGGKKERDPSVCGADAAPQCETWLTENMGTEDKVEQMIAGLDSCEGEMAVYKQYSQMGKDYLIGFFFRPVYQNCGYEAPYAMPSASTCMGAASILSRLDQYCPKNCDESDDGLCPGGKKERDPSVCGADAAPQCETWLTENMGTEDKVEQMIAGLDSCEGEMAFYKQYSQMGKDYLIGIFFRPVYQNCGYEAPYAMPSASTCMGAVSIVTGVDQYCPKNCDESDDGLCPGGKKERDPSVCGADAAPQCETWLTENMRTEETIEEMMAGLDTCEGALAGYKAYSQMGADFVKGFADSVFADCGYPSSTPTPKRKNKRRATRSKKSKKSKKAKASPGKSKRRTSAKKGKRR